MTRKTYDGPLLIGEDLMAFRLERDQVVQMAPRSLMVDCGCCSRHERPLAAPTNVRINLVIKSGQRVCPHSLRQKRVEGRDDT